MLKHLWSSSAPIKGAPSLCGWRYSPKVAKLNDLASDVCPTCAELAPTTVRHTTTTSASTQRNALRLNAKQISQAGLVTEHRSTLKTTGEVFTAMAILAPSRTFTSSGTASQITSAKRTTKRQPGPLSGATVDNLADLVADAFGTRDISNLVRSVVIQAESLPVGVRNHNELGSVAAIDTRTRRDPGAFAQDASSHGAKRNDLANRAERTRQTRAGRDVVRARKPVDPTGRVTGYRSTTAAERDATKQLADRLSTVTVRDMTGTILRTEIAKPIGTTRRSEERMTALVGPRDDIQVGRGIRTVVDQGGARIDQVTVTQPRSFTLSTTADHPAIADRMRDRMPVGPDHAIGATGTVGMPMVTCADGKTVWLPHFAELETERARLARSLAATRDLAQRGSVDYWANGPAPTARMAPNVTTGETAPDRAKDHVSV